MLAQDDLYVVRLLRSLAASFPSPVGEAEHVTATRAPLAFVSILLQDLREAGTVVRSPDGGICLSRPPEDLRLCEVLLHSGPRGKTPPSCGIDLVLAQARQALLRTLEPLALSELA